MKETLAGALRYEGGACHSTNIPDGLNLQTHPIHNVIMVMTMDGMT